MPKTIISKKDTTKKATKEKGEEKKEKLKAKEVVQTAAQEEVPKQEASLFKSVPKEAPVISEPVKATPIERKKDGDRKKISTFGLSKERDHFIENLSMLVLSGMAITEALRAVVKETKDARMKEILTQVMDDIEAGSPIWKAFTET
mgnify:FL=1